jgi:hypothetical protein
MAIPASWVTATGVLQNFVAGWHTVADVTDRASIPEGHRHPGAWVLARVAGGLSSRNYIYGEGDLVGAIAGGKNATATLSGSGDLSGTAALVVSLIASIGGSGTVTGSALAFLNLAAALAGSGDLAGAANALANAQAILAGSGTVVGTFAGATIGVLAASITVTGTGLTTANVGQAVWDAIASANNNAGTMGELLNNAGAGANPWTVTLEGSYTAADILRILVAVAAGQTTIVDLGGGDATVTFQGIDLATDRVIADMTGSERITMTLDPAP